MKVYLAISIFVLLAGCNIEQHAPDQCLRAELFKQCLADIPKGPEVTHNNAWDGVVAECEQAAARQSYRKELQIKPECRP